MKKILYITCYLSLVGCSMGISIIQEHILKALTGGNRQTNND